MKRQAGFSLTEILITVGVIVLFMSVAFPNLSSLLHWSDRLQTESRLQLLRDAMTQTYEQNAWQIDNNNVTGNTLTFGSSNQYQLATCNAGCSLALVATMGSPTGTYPQTGFEALAAYAGLPAGKLAEDGFNRPFQVYVSNRLSTTWRNYTLYYHVIAFVSNSGKASNTVNWDPTTGKLTIPAGSHAQAVVVNGAVIEQQLALKTLDKLNNIASAYQQYFQTQYLSNPSRDISIDYFAKGTTTSWDTGSTIDVTAGQSFGSPDGAAQCTDMAPMTSNGFQSTLALAQDSISDAWGNVMGVGTGYQSSCPLPGGGNSSANRNPSNATAPYTAWLSAWLPGDQAMLVTVMGHY